MGSADKVREKSFPELIVFVEEWRSRRAWEKGSKTGGESSSGQKLAPTSGCGHRESEIGRSREERFMESDSVVGAGLQSG